MTNTTFIITKAHHAPLYQRCDLNSGRLVKIGDYQGPCAPEDRATRAEYRCLGWPSKKNDSKVSHPSGLKPGLFYPENIFITGVDDNNDSLTHEQLETFKQKFWAAGTKRVILPVGYNKGKMTWENGLMYSPIENKPQWYGLEERIKNLFTKDGADVYCDGYNRIEIFFETWNK